MTYAIAQIRNYLLILLGQLTAAPSIAVLRAYFDGLEPPDRIGRLIQQLRQENLIAADNAGIERPIYQYRLTRAGESALAKLESQQLPQLIATRLKDPSFPGDEIAAAMTRAEKTRLGALQMDAGVAGEIIRVLRDAEDPLAPREILGRLTSGISNKTLRAYLQRLCKTGSIIGDGNTSARLYTMPTREAELTALVTASKYNGTPGRNPNQKTPEVIEAENDIVEILRNAPRPMSPGAIMEKSRLNNRRDLLTYRLKNLIDAGRVVCQGATASRRCTIAERAEELQPKRVDTEAAPEPPVSAPPPAREPQTRTAAGKPATEDILRENAKAADVALWRYVESCVDPDIYTCLKRQCDAANRALARFMEEITA